MRMIDADALKASMHMANDCNKCEQNPAWCNASPIYSRQEICGYIDDMPTVELPGWWISVKDRLPEEDDAYLIFIKGHYVQIGWYWAEQKKWLIDGSLNGTNYISHWMKLPEPPKGCGGK